MYNRPLVPDQFAVPESLTTDRITLRPLVVEDVDNDFAAVMSSEVRLRTIFRPGGDWPLGLTLEQNKLELAWHQVEFQLRTSFAYTVVNLADSEILGCMYIYPIEGEEYEVEVNMWVRESEANTGLDAHLYQTVRDWIREVWPFSRVAYPGREIPWEEWDKFVL